MADLAVSIAERLIEVTASAVIRELCDMWGYESQLSDLNKTICTIKNVLLDADQTKRKLSNQERGYIEDLKDAVYDADDLFDEFFTAAELKRLDCHKPGAGAGAAALSRKVRKFFSTKKKNVNQAYKMSRQVKAMKRRLDAVVDKHKSFGFIVDYKPIRRRDDTCSYVLDHARDIIGRDNDKRAIIDVLLGRPPQLEGDTSVQFLTIVGVGGLGKTTLAQLVFNDEKIKDEFSDFRWWVCVSDQDQEDLDVQGILTKILFQQTDAGSFSMELVQAKFREKLRSGRKYLLVLDDVWTEDRKKWLHLQNFLMLGQGGSRIVVTSRSHRTAAIVGDGHIYNLGVLALEDSWHLFEMAAFCNKQQPLGAEIVEIGRKIVKKCYNNPLAIKVVGSLLYGQDISKWRSFEESGLSEIRKGDNEIMSILKLSYHNLESSLKSCFAYCALFPKDTVIQKQMLISLWIAQGYIVSFDRGQSIEDAAEEHFLILLRRCFFQEVCKDAYGDILNVKIHDLMHDVAQEIGSGEISVVSSIKNLGDEIRHMHYVGDRSLGSITLKSKIRSFIYRGLLKNSHQVITQVDNCKHLRVLDLKFANFGGRRSPDSIGKLLHLRYLKLSFNESLEILSDSITELHNLQSLVLFGCSNLREFPTKFCKLKKLRHLDLLWCDNLNGMPLGMDQLTSLRALTYFVVGKSKRLPTGIQCHGELKDLKALTNINGTICITIGKHHRHVECMNEEKARYLKNTKHLKEVSIKFDDGCVDAQAVMEELEPHSNLKGFILHNYMGTIIPRWGRAEDNWAHTLFNLVQIKLLYCEELEQMPLLSKLPFLKSLELNYLQKLNYMEHTSTSSGNYFNVPDSTTLFFPSLECLEINQLNSLKGWWRRAGVVDVEDHISRKFRFLRLSRLKIVGCSELSSFPPCPNLEVLELFGNNKRLNILENMGNEEDNGIRLKVVVTDKVGSLKSMHSPCLKVLNICLREVEGYEVREVFHSITSLKSLELHGCDNLRMLNNVGLEHLISLESLLISQSSLGDNEEIIGNDNGNDNDHGDDHNQCLPWAVLNQSLRSLKFESQRNMMNLPKWMLYLTSLQSLRISWCYKLDALPEWISCLSSLRSLSVRGCLALRSLPKSMRNLTSLQTLVIQHCPNLCERCAEPNGEDWPKIQHIPCITIRDW